MLELVGGEEELAAVCAAEDGFEGDGEAESFVGTEHFQALVDGHLGVLVAVVPEERWIGFIDVKDGAGEAGEVGFGVGLSAEEQFEGGNAHVDAVGSGLGEDGRQVRGAVEDDDGLDVGGLAFMVAEIAFEFLVAVGYADERGEVTAGGAAANGDFLCGNAVVVSRAAEVANGGFDVVDLGRELGDGGKAVVDAGDGEAFVG